MTLVAAFEFNETPILIGDFQLTWVTGDDSGLRKKICILNEFIAIAWTGSLLYAEAAMRLLREGISMSVLDKSSIRDLLGCLSEVGPENGELELVGWLITDKPNCFKWSSKIPFRVDFCESAYAGSGKDVCIDLFGKSGPKGSMPKPQSKCDKDAFLISHLANMMRHEHFSSSRLGEGRGFGFGFECMVYNNGKFEYFSDVAFFQIKAYLDRAGKVVNVVLNDKFMAYFSRESMSYLAFTSQSKGETSLHVISTPGIDKETSQKAELERHVINFRASAFRYRMYCVFVAFSSTELYVENVILPFSAPEAGRYIKVRGKSLELSINPAVLEALYRGVRADLMMDR